MITPKPPKIPSDLPSAELYLDDIERIVTVVRNRVPEAHGNLEVLYELKDAHCSELQELKQYGPKIEGLKINFRFRSSNARVSISLSIRPTWYAIGLSEETERALYHDIEAVIRRKQNWISRFVPTSLLRQILLSLFVSAVSFGTFYLLREFKYPALRLNAYWSSALVALNLLVTQFWFIGMKGYALVHASFSWEKREKRSDTRTKIIIGFISSVVTALVLAGFKLLVSGHL